MKTLTEVAALALGAALSAAEGLACRTWQPSDEALIFPAAAAAAALSSSRLTNLSTGKSLQPATQGADAIKPIVVVARCPSGKRVMGCCLQ